MSRLAVRLVSGSRRPDAARDKKHRASKARIVSEPANQKLTQYESRWANSYREASNVVLPTSFPPTKAIT